LSGFILSHVDPLAIMSPHQFASSDLVSESSSTASPSTDGHESNHGVGLSNPSLSQGRRRMLDLVNRLHNTGFVIL
jgi:hypothetical protein